MLALLDDGTVLAWGPGIGAAGRSPSPLAGLPRIRHILVGNSINSVVYLLATDGRVFKIDGNGNPFVPVEITSLLQ